MDTYTLSEKEANIILNYRAAMDRLNDLLQSALSAICAAHDLEGEYTLQISNKTVALVKVKE